MATTAAEMTHRALRIKNWQSDLLVALLYLLIE
jgi:hypothetical protein